MTDEKFKELMNYIKNLKQFGLTDAEKKNKKC